MNWRDFWNQDTPIYVNELHKRLHYDGVAADLAALVPHVDAVVLDYGCGEALAADRVAATCGRLYLCDTASLVRERLSARFAREPKIAVLAPDDVAALPDAFLDLIVLNSVAQYLTRFELSEFLILARRKVKPDGRVILADIIPPNVSPVADAMALLRFARRGGFLTAALVGLVRTALSDYRRLRESLGLTTYSEAEILAFMKDHGFKAERRRRNVGHNAARMTLIGRPV
jgi:SAM-dependent methyltransferase